MANDLFGTGYKSEKPTLSSIEAPKDNGQGRIADSVDSAQGGALGAMGGMFDFVGAQGIAQSLYGAADDQQSQMSQRGRDALQKSFVEEGEDGTLQLGEGATDLDTWILTMANVAGQFAGTAIPGGAVAKGVTKVASLGSKGEKVAQAATMGATGGAAATGQGMEQARKEVMNMPDEMLAESPMFADALREIHKKNPKLSSTEKWDLTKEEIAGRVAQDVRTDPKVLLANFGASAIGDPIIGRALTGARLAKGSVVKSSIAGFATEGATETAQAATQQLGINEALQPLDNRDTMQGVTAAGLNEGLAGGGFGALAGGLGGVANRNQDENKDKDTPKNQQSEASASFESQSQEVVKNGVDQLVGSGMDREEAIATIKSQQFNAAKKKGLSDLDAAVAVSNTMKQAFDIDDPVLDVLGGDIASTQDPQEIEQEMSQAQDVDYDTPTAARQAGFEQTNKAAGQYGDMLSSPAQQSLKDLDAGNNTPTVDERVKAAAFDKSPTPEDRFSPVKYQHEGEFLGPKSQNYQGIENAPIDGQTVPEQVKQAGKDSQNLLPQKDIVFADDESGVNVAKNGQPFKVAKNGQPFKTKRDALLSKAARAARREGQKTKAVNFGDGFGWAIKDNAQSTAPNTGADIGADIQQADAANSEAPESATPATTGKKEKVYTPSNEEIDVEYQLVDVNDLVASNDIAGNVNPSYPQELQPRDRSRVSSQAQVSSIAKNIKPDRLGKSMETDRGAPIAKDRVVESGNGRTIALKEAYRTGKAEAYKQYLKDNAAEFGLTPQQIDNIKSPILVRNRLTDLTPAQRQAFTVDSNRSAGIEQSPTEQADSDANLLTADDMQLLNVPESGNIMGSENQPFLYQFAKKLGDNESSKYRQKDGTWNSQFAARVNNAIFARAYQDPTLLSQLSESTNVESKNLISAMLSGAPKVAAMNTGDASVGDATGQALSETISSAAQMVMKARRENVSLSDLVSQIDLVNGQEPAEVQSLASVLNDNIRSAKKMSAIINDIADQLTTAINNSEQPDIFTGEVAEIPTVDEVINNVTGQEQSQQATDTSASIPSSEQEGRQESTPNSMESNASQGSESGVNSQATVKQQSSKLDTAANDISIKKKAAAEKLKKLIKSKKGQLNSGIDPEIMIAVAEVGALSIAEGAVKFAQWARDVLNTTRAVGISDEDVKPFLKQSYGAMNADPQRYGISDDIADTMDLPRDIRNFDINSIESENDVSTTSENMEQASKGGDSEQEYQNRNDDESDGIKQVPSRAESDIAEEQRPNGELGLSTNDGALQGESSTESLLNGNGSIGGGKNTGDTGNDGRGNSDNDNGTPLEQEPAAAVDEATSRVATDKQANQTKRKTNHTAKWGDEADILESVPVLMPAQAGDIAKIESRFFGEENPGAGYQNTNGTGTGKTFVGLGTLKRFAQSGKTNALVAVPNDGIAQQWVQAAKEHFGLDVYLIGSDGGAKAKDPGRGITITTYSTLGNNDQLIKSRDKFDLIIADESQNLMGSQQAKVTNALESLRALTNHEEGANRRAKAYLTEELEALDKKIKAKAKQLAQPGEEGKKALAEAKEFYQKESTNLANRVQALATGFKEEGPTDSKVLFLSATPFPYVKNLDYAEGYLFNYTDYGDKFEGGYDNAFTGRNAFYIQNFGYRWRYHKLNTPGSEVDQSLMERQFHENMKDQGVLGGRTLEVDADYRRDFIKVETAAGEKLDDLIEKWRDHSVGGEGESEASERPYSELADILNKTFDYTKKIKLTEAIKAQEAVSRAKEHIKQGRKVVLFHSYNVGGSFDPVESVRQAKPELVGKFEKEFPGMTNIDFGVLARPLDLFANEFGDSVRFYNGNVPDKARKEAKDLFNSDESGVDVIVVQQEAGEAGISLHDITGGKQRVLINIGMPVKPTQFIQIEGRIYRVGVKTDAQFENLTTGTAFERNIFASKIAGRASTAENLAMGEFARSLKENISEGYLDADHLPVGAEIGKGGKASDRPAAIDDWDRAKTFYYANLKRNQGTKSAEGDDYFATPEPVGKKMVEWLQPLPGHRMLEPSVGHAAIGRWFPGTTRNKATEKSFKLTSLAQMNFPGEVDNIPFEDLNVINKFEGIAMNPPFGKGGKLAYEHIRKAITHLVNGGRIVALVPDGPAANKRLDALLTDEKLANIYQAAEVDLPGGVFDRAGTGVKTKIVVLDRFDNEVDAPNMQRVSFNSAKDINELFERIKDVEIRERKQPTPVEYDIDQYMNASSKPTKNRKGEDAYQIKLYGYLPFEVKDVIDKEGANEFGAIPARDERVYSLDNDDARQDFSQFIAQTIEEAKESGVEFDFKPPKEKVRVTGQQSNEHFEASGETYTTKRGKEFLVTEMLDRQDREVYAALKDLAKDFGGWARGQKFMFNSLDDIEQFNAQARAIINGESDIKFSKSKAKKKAKGVNASQAQTIADDFIKSLNGANGITVNILEDTATAEKLWRMSLDGATVKGAYSDQTNTVYVIAENIDSITDLKQTLAHETIAHGGLDTVIGKEAHQAFIDRIKKTKGRKAFDKYWKDANNDYWDMSDDVKAEEIFARFVENEPSKGELKYWWQALKRFIRAQLDKLGVAYREDDEVTAMRDMLESIVKGFKSQREPESGRQTEMAYSQSDKKFSRTANEDTRTSKQKLGLEEQAAESISDAAKAKVNSTIDTLKSSPFWNRLNEGIFDGLAGIKQAEEAAGVTDPNQQGYVSARLASGLADVLHGVFNYGAPQWRDGIVQRKKGTKGLLEVFGMVGDDLNDWLAWMGANRAERLKAEGKENNLNDADIAELKALANGKERLFEQTRREYNKVNSSILDMAQEAGLLSEAQRSGFDEEYYVPFFRDMGETDPEMDDIKRMIVEPHTRKGIASQSAQLKEIKGGGQSTKDLLENIIARQSTLIDASLKNKAMQEVVNNLNGSDYMQAVESEDIASLSQHDLNKLGKVKVMVNGQQQAYVVSDPALLRSLIQVNDVGSKSLFNKLGRSAKRFLTAGITLSPDFIFKNFVRDAAHAWMINKDGFTFGSDSYKGLKKAFKEDESYRDLIFSGAAFQGGYIHGADPEAGAQQMRRALRSKGLTSKEVEGFMATVVTNGATLLEKYRGISDKVENANRLSTYEAAITAGKSKRQAAYEAKDLMDYSLKGNYKLIGTMIDMLPFFNARLQGMSKLVRAAKASNDDRVLRVLSANLAMKGIKVAAFSLALAAMNDDDEEYQQLPDWDKDMNWHFFIDGEHMRIPKPFELGIVFGTMPERLFHYGTGSQTDKELGKAVSNAVFNTMSLNPIPQMVLPAAEVMINKSFFKGSPIEGMADQNKQAEDRYNAYTSDTAKSIAQAFGVSPKKVEHLIKGYTGTIGGYVLGASDIVARLMTGKEAPDTPVSRYPVVKAFYQGNGPKSNTKFANDFYEALDAANQAYGSYKRAMELGDTSRQQELIEKDGNKLRHKSSLAKVQRSISKLRKMQKAINDNERLNGTQKREKLDDIQRKINAIYHKAYVTMNLGEW